MNFQQESTKLRPYSFESAKNVFFGAAGSVELDEFIKKGNSIRALLYGGNHEEKLKEEYQILYMIVNFRMTGMQMTEWWRALSVDDYLIVLLSLLGGQEIWGAFVNLSNNFSSDNLHILKNYYKNSLGIEVDIMDNDTNITQIHVASYRCKFLLLEVQFIRQDNTLNNMKTFNASKNLMNDIYDTLEHDEAVFEGWKKTTNLKILDSSFLDVGLDLQANNGIIETHKKDAKSPKISQILKTVEDLPGIGNMKHLIGAIERHISDDSSNSITAINGIKSLLQEIKPKASNASKWATEDYVGLAELYEAFEKVLEQLKGYKKHSFPFLNKVNKRDAPDYYEVIRNPMDLGFMGKKLRAKKYFKKEEFESDLNLIWENCLYYNSDPSSIYRVHANEMKKKANELLKAVPNIIVRHRSDLEAEGYDSDYIEYVESSASAGTGSVDEPKSLGQSPIKSMIENSASEPTMEESSIKPKSDEPKINLDLVDESVEVDYSRRSNETFHPNEHFKRCKNFFSGLCKVVLTSKDEDKLDNLIFNDHSSLTEENEALETRVTDSLDQSLIDVKEVYRELMAESIFLRKKALSHISSLGNMSFERSPENMMEYYELKELQLENERCKQFYKSIICHGFDQQNVSSDDLIFLPERNHFFGCFPDNVLFPKCENGSEERFKDTQTTSRYESIFNFLDIDRSMKSLDTKSLDLGFSKNFSDEVGFQRAEKYSFSHLNQVSLENRQRDLIVKKLISQLIRNSGFDKSSFSCIHILSDVFSAHIANICRIWKREVEKYG